MHPLSMFTMLCTGVLLYGLTAGVLADTTVSSVVEAPPLKIAATITAPADKTTTVSPSVQVTGTCPTNSYVNLLDNGAFSGTAWCSPNSDYTIPASLYPSNNTLSVQAYNVTNLPGPKTSGITLTYDPPVVAGSTSAGASSASTGQPTNTNTKSASTLAQNDQSGSTPPIVLTSTFKFTTFTAKQQFSWSLDLEGGVPPYKVHVDWGDGSNSDLVFKTDPVFTLYHLYAKAGYFPINIHSTDSKNQVKVLQLAALIKAPDGTLPFISTPKSGTNGSLAVTPTAKSPAIELLPFAWPSYAVLILMTASFWLGEIREYRNMSQKTRRS